MTKVFSLYRILSGPRNFPGIFVEKVRPGSLAHEAGLDVGDQIVEVNDTNFLNISHNEVQKTKELMWFLLSREHPKCVQGGKLFCVCLHESTLEGI